METYPPAPCGGCGKTFVPEGVEVPHPLLEGKVLVLKTRVCPPCSGEAPRRRIPEAREILRLIS
jgi:hypothetical protein